MAYVEIRLVKGHDYFRRASYEGKRYTPGSTYRYPCVCAEAVKSLFGVDEPHVSVKLHARPGKGRMGFEVRFGLAADIAVPVYRVLSIRAIGARRGISILYPHLDGIIEGMRSRGLLREGKRPNEYLVWASVTPRTLAKGSAAAEIWADDGPMVVTKGKGREPLFPVVR